MSHRVLVTTSSFLDTPGPHHDRLKATGYELITARGPLSESELMEVVRLNQPIHAILCGEDDFTKKVIEQISPLVRVVSKYGVGLDRIDLETAKRLGVVVTNTPGVNHSAVAELTFGLLLSLVRRIPEQNTLVHKAEWKRLTGFDLAGKTLGIFGLGRVGKEVAKRAMAFGMKVLVYNTNWSAAHSSFVGELNNLFSSPIFGENSPKIARAANIEEILGISDFISLHMNLTRENQHFLDRERLSICKRRLYVVNVSRGALVDQDAMAEALKRGQIAGYASDVLEPEPVRPENPLLGLNNVVLTPHIGSRTYDSVARQGVAAVENIVAVLESSPSQRQQRSNSP